MLKQLTISNYALIDFIEINFNEGFSIITGETGAGKSIMLGAMQLILGERGDAKTVRNKDKKSVIEAQFDLSGYELNQYFYDNEIDYDNISILRREILANGRSRAFINDTPVTIAQLHGLAIRLIDIHSQHNNQLLADSSYQLSIIDSIALNESIILDYASIYDKYSDARNRLAQLKSHIGKNKVEEEYMRFQLSQLSELKLQAGEESELESEQLKLSNVVEIKSALWEASQTLNGDELSVLRSLKNVSSKLQSLNKILVDAPDLQQRIDSAIIEIKDIAETTDTLMDDMVDDPAELERIDNRLNDIYTQKRKHGVETVEELIDIENKLSGSLNEIDNSEYNLAQLQNEVDKYKSQLLIIADELSKSRKIAAQKFSDELQEIAIPLGMKNIQCKVQFESIEPSHFGTDKLQFLFAFNKNQQLLPIGNTASGGEISRLMLCVKLIVARTMQMPTLIFDEIDTGVSGDIANKMAEMMSEIAQKRQVITITHLPQVAAMGNTHYKVYKKDTHDATISSISELNHEERVKEIAGMLSGAKINQAAIDNALSLLNHI